MSVKNHPTTEAKKPKNQSSTENDEQFCFFGSLVRWFFGFLVLWFFGFLNFVLKHNPLYNKTKRKPNPAFGIEVWEDKH